MNSPELYFQNVCDKAYPHSNDGFKVHVHSVQKFKWPRKGRTIYGSMILVTPLVVTATALASSPTEPEVSLESDIEDSTKPTLSRLSNEHVSPVLPYHDCPVPPSMFADMCDEDHDQYTRRTDIVLDTSPYFERPTQSSVFDLMRGHNISIDVAIIFMLDSLLKKRGGDVRQLFVDHALRCAMEQEAMESQNEEVPPPVAMKSLTSKQKAAKRKVAAAVKRSSKK
ncbi:hypothetical protein B5M09_005825 [Aphanomyces astaci]|uniref:Uncharacterized protein n=1 Tax=Aphanomyces astaci TaxID=112090 RepID=A0A3R7YCP7_APHAT|nr:hypothetical protein B5M09_005825 [Aphanomyces astaci]